MSGHNIDFVNPTRSNMKTKISASLKIPIIYDTNVYKTIDGLKRVEGLKG